MQDLIDGKALKRWQDKFCNAANVYAYCMDSGGQPVTEMSGSETDTGRIRQAVPEEAFQGIYRRVAEGELEEQAVEDTSVPNLQLAAISVRIAENAEIVWIVCGIITDGAVDETAAPLFSGFEFEVTEKAFYAALDLLRDTAHTILQTRHAMLRAEAEVRKSRYSELEMSAALKRNAAVAEVIKQLESDNALDVILTEVLKILGTYLGISMAAICRIHKEKDNMDITAKWHGGGLAPVFEKSGEQPCTDILKTDKVIVLSSGTALNAKEQEGMHLFGANALVVIPILLHGEGKLCACFGECGRERQWQIEEVRFLNDAVKIIQNIILKRIQKNSLAGSYATLETILDNVGSSIYVRDIQTGGVLFANRSFKNNFSAEIKAGSLSAILEWGMETELQSGNYEVFHAERERWYDLYYTHISWVDGRPVTLFAIYDITEKKVYQKKIEQQAHTDFLTGLYNRLCCERDLARHIEEAKKSGNRGALLYLDLDDFKHINDGLGHQYGDILLKSISYSLQNVEAIGNTCYRMGGDEFVIIVPPQSHARLEKIVSEIKKIFAKPWFLKDGDYYCTMSMGVVDFPEEGESVHELIKKADIAMYEAKKLGKNRVAQYSNQIDSSSNRRLDMEKNMRDAAASGFREFEIYYQPIIDIQLPDNPCTGAEALLRWNSAELGFIPPSEFIPLAEYLGLINPIGNHVLKEACIHCKEWNESGYPNYKVNVNLSVVQLLQGNIVELVAESLKETGVNPRNLTLEVTESLAINDMECMKEILGNIRRLGVRIALDDFGTGYSSLNHIREIPLDVIKVDQSFVRDLAEDAYSQSFIRMVAELADAIDVSICVEGIETKEQYKVLEGMKVRLVQGYYFDKPMPRAGFEKKYVKRNK